MKNAFTRHISPAVIFFAMVFSALNVSAAEINTPTLSVTGYGEVVAKPDMAEFSVAIQADRSQAKQAKTAVDKVVGNFIVSLTQSGMERKSIVSSYLRLSPQYNYPKDGKPVLNGYRAVREITVTVEQLDKLNTYLDLALQSGVNQVNSINLKVKDETQYKQQARQAAIADAKQKAQELAKGFDSELNGVWSIIYRSNSVRPVMMAKAMAMESRSADQGYQDEEMTISDQVDVIFKLKN
ncbi:oxidative stress defense protein [Vibrio rumoiensis]|uniref:oxidative stress defense protein n=1 Tax=Vibrio rumoiensis TaxID=76258 RepID=UPI00374A44F7